MPIRGVNRVTMVKILHPRHIPQLKLMPHIRRVHGRSDMLFANSKCSSRSRMRRFRVPQAVLPRGYHRDIYGRTPLPGHHRLTHDAQVDPLLLAFGKRGKLGRQCGNGRVIGQYPRVVVELNEALSLAISYFPIEVDGGAERDLPHTLGFGIR